MRDIHFVVEGRPFPSSLWVPQSDAALRRVVDQERSSIPSLLWPGLVEPKWLRPTHLDEDGKRLEVWFAEHGYFDARFDHHEVTRHRPARARMHTVTVRYFLDQGERSHVRTITIEGLGEKRASLERRLRGMIPLVEGRGFSGTDYEASLGILRTEMLKSGYAFVNVHGSVEAYPEERAVDVEILINPGVKSTFGPVTVTGVKRMPRRIVEDAVTIEEGEPFSTQPLAETRTALFGLRVFSSVDVKPDLSAPESGVVPVTVTVKGTKTRRLKIGPGVAIETGKGTVYASAEWEDTNLFHRLLHFDQTLTAGAAGVVAQTRLTDRFAWSDVTVAPVGEAVTTLGVPHVIGKDVSVDVTGKLELGLESGYRFFSAELAPALTWHHWTHLTASAGYSIRWFDYDFFVDTQEIVDSPLGLDVTDPYLLSMLTQHVTWDGRDVPMSPTRGWYGSLAFAEAGGPFGGNYRFVRSQAELRGYRSAPLVSHWNPKLIVAARVGAGLITPYGDGPEATAPYAERLYLGGGTTVRGWAANRLGPHVDVTNTTTGEQESLPAGGYLDVYGNLELRKVLVGPLSMAAFTDVGRVWATPDQFRWDGLQWSVGGGLRYATAIGPVRADFGWRLGDGFPGQTPRWALHFGLSEAF